ncbi:putative metallocarboxypeptidase A [Paramyrothecium foliicola]|nr:putative metallocarboxypeptidase A [Paramyrothecium foliicola]
MARLEVAHRAVVSDGLLSRFVGEEVVKHQHPPLHLSLMKFAVSTLALASVALASGSGPVGPVERDPVVTYDGHHIYRIEADSAQEIENIEARFAHFPSAHSPRAIELVVPPNKVRAFEEEMGVHARLLSNDLGAQIRAESAPSNYRRGLNKRGDLPDPSWFDSYHSYADHLDWWDDIHAAFPENSEKINLGQSYEGRDIHAFHLWGDEGSSTEKPIVYWHGTVHAREWISTMVVEYLTYQLVDGYKSGDKNVTAFLNHYDFWIVPFHNPDGFSYTQTNNRLWRKNRQPRGNTTCLGTDLNRNWNYQWYAEPPDGAVSPDPCSETFKGRCPGDTPENVALSALSKKLAATGQGIRSYIDWHSYGQLILTPWGWSCRPEDLPASLPRMREVGAGVARAIFAESGKNYTTGPACEVLYFSTGTGRDYHHGALNATHSWTLELRPFNAREGGFVLPPSEIWSTVKEQWAGQQYLLAEVWDN